MKHPVDLVLPVDVKASKTAEVSTSVVAYQLSKMRYDVLAIFLGQLRNCLLDQVEADKKRGRPKLASEVLEASDRLESARVSMMDAWIVSEPHMKTNE